MADILIRGMEMPIDCHSCWMRIYCFGRGIGIWGRGKGKPCPILNLPEGHGRLGDLDALQEEFKKSHDGKRLMLIDTAPTIVPSEGGGEDG